MQRDRRSRAILAAIVGALVVATTPSVQASPGQDGQRCPGIQTAQVYPFDPPAVSKNAREVAFTTAAPLTEDDHNDTLDVYLWSASTRSYERISVGANGAEVDEPSRRPAITPDGRFVAFQSGGPLLPGDDDGVGPDVFVYDRTRRVLTQVSVSRDGMPTLTESSNPSISADGRFVAFASTSDNLVPEDKNAYADVFVRDLRMDTTVRVSVSSNGEEGDYISGGSSFGGLDISASGRFVAFASGAGNLVADDADPFNWDVLVHDLRTSKTERVSLNSEEAEAGGLSLSPSISDDGRFVAFASSATNLVEDDENNDGLGGGYVTDVFVRDREEGVTERVSIASDGSEEDGSSHAPSISADGRFVAFSSRADNLASGDGNQELDVFVHDRKTGHTTRPSVGEKGEDSKPGGSMSWGSLSPAIAPDSDAVAFASGATNLAADDDNGVFDVFVRGAPGAKGLARLSTPCGGKEARASSESLSAPWMSSLPPEKMAWLGLAVVVMVVLLALIGGGRRLVALGVAVVTAASVSPAGAHHYSPIQPGAQFNTESDPCTMNFVFRDRSGGLFIGTAAHCVRRVIGADGAVGGRVLAEGVGTFGTTVYGRQGLLAPVRIDFSLIKIDPDKHELVDPSVRAWGGPSGVATDYAPGSGTLQYGFGAILRNTEPSRAKSGVLVRVATSGEWEGWNVDARAAIGGDSGSPVLSQDGEALGIATHLAYGLGQPGTVMGPTVALIMNELRLAGFDLQLVTAPFPAAPTEMAQHCASKPVDESHRGDGCVRSSPGP